MAALAFDTHKAVTALKQAGFAEPQAEAVVNTMGEALGGTVATKADMAELRAEMAALRTELKGDLTAVQAKLEAEIAAVQAKLEAEIAAVQAKLEAEIAAVKTDMAEQFAALYKQLWVMAVGIVGLTVTLVKLIP
jgi:predicted  nucleic acid-binding Zn-ribbon protein